MSTEDEIINRVAKDMADVLDWEIFAEHCVKAGWTEVALQDFWRYNLVEVNQWCRDNCRDKATGYKARWLFKQASDATWFTLKWAQ